VQEVLSDAGSTSYKNELALPVLVGNVFALNDLGMNTLLPPFLGTLNVYVLLTMHCGGNR